MLGKMTENEVIVKTEDKLLRDTSSIKKNNDTLRIGILAIMTALETAATMIIIPLGSGGYFNVGECIIYFSAICFGAYYAAFIGGVGAAIADVAAGFAAYAPGTLIIKGIEGFVVGYIYHKLKNRDKLKENWKQITVSISMVLGIALIGLGYKIESINSDFNPIVTLIVGFVLIICGIFIGFYIQEEIGIKLISFIPGGVILVLGYYLYYIFAFDDPNSGLGEIPFNILQFLMSVFIAIPLITATEPYVKRYFES